MLLELAYKYRSFVRRPSCEGNASNSLPFIFLQYGKIKLMSSCWMRIELCLFPLTKHPDLTNSQFPKEATPLGYSKSICDSDSDRIEVSNSRFTKPRTSLTFRPKQSAGQLETAKTSNCGCSRRPFAKQSSKKSILWLSKLGYQTYNSVKPVKRPIWVGKKTK